MAVFLLSLLIIIVLCQSQSRYRLPVTVRPINYEIALEFKFVYNETDLSMMSGISTILINITDPQFILYTNTPSSSSIDIKINMGSNLEIIESDLFFPLLNETLNLENSTFDNDAQIATFRYKINEDLTDVINNLDSNWLLSELYFSFVTKLIDGGESGMYITSYTYNDTTIKNAVSSFGVLDARKAFPCILYVYSIHISI